jgi:hypothetical protein
MQYIQTFEILIVDSRGDSVPFWEQIELQAQFEKREQAIEHFSGVLGQFRKAADIKNVKLTEDGAEIKAS